MGAVAYRLHYVKSTGGAWAFHFKTVATQLPPDGAGGVPGLWNSASARSVDVRTVCTRAPSARSRTPHAVRVGVRAVVAGLDRAGFPECITDFLKIPFSSSCTALGHLEATGSDRGPFKFL